MHACDDVDGAALAAGAGDPNLFANLTTADDAVGADGLMEPGDEVSATVTVYVDPHLLTLTETDGTPKKVHNSAVGHAYTDSDGDGSPDVVDENDGTEGPGDDPNPLFDDPSISDTSDHDDDLDGEGDPTDDDTDGNPNNDPSPHDIGAEVLRE